MKTKITYYDILGIERDADIDDIKKAYRMLAKADHPDINGSSKTVNKRMALLNKAYETLIDPIKRKDYDEQIDRDEINYNQYTDPVSHEEAKTYDNTGNNTVNTSKKKWNWKVLVFIIILIVIGNQIDSYLKTNLHKPAVPTLSQQIITPRPSPKTLPSNYVSCGMNSYLVNGIFCDCFPGYEREHNTGKCVKSK